MLFKNATMYRIPSDFKIEIPDLVSGLHERKLRDVGALELSSIGFVPVIPGDDKLVIGSGRAIAMTVGKQEKILPPGVINAELAKRLAAFEESEGRKPWGRTLNRIKDEVVADLLPRAFVKTTHTNVIIDFASCVVFVDTASRHVGDMVCSEIRHAWGSFPTQPVHPHRETLALMTDWVGCAHNAPLDVRVGDECELIDPSGSDAVVTIRRMDLDGEEVANHLSAGKMVSKLMMHFEAGCSAVVTRDIGLRKIRLSDVSMGKLDDQDLEGVEQEFMARLTLVAGVLGGCFEALDGAFCILDA